MQIDKIDKAIKYLQTGELDRAFEVLESFEGMTSSSKEMYRLISFRYTSQNKLKNTGVITFGEYTLELNRIASSLNSLLEEITNENEFSNNQVDKTDLISHYSKKLIDSGQLSIKMPTISIPVELDEIFIDFNMLDKPAKDSLFFDFRYDLYRSANDKFDRLGLNEIKRRNLDVFSTLKKYNRILIYGKPGSGKTTLLKYLAKKIIEKELFDDKVPFLISLNSRYQEILSNQSLISLLSSCIGSNRNYSTINNWLENGMCVVLLDGLDELPLGERIKVMQAIVDFSVKFPKNKYIITCRTQSYLYKHDGYLEVELADFSEENKKAFIKNWFGLFLDNEDANKLAAKLIYEISEKEYINELCNRPVLLSIICSIYYDESKVPKRKVDLYDRMISRSINKWDNARGVKRSNIEFSINEVLEYLAFFFLSRNKVFFEVKEIYDAIYNFKDGQLGVSENFLVEIEEHTGLIVERFDSYYSFSHLTIQEYFTSIYLCKNYENPSDLLSEILRIGSKIVTDLTFQQYDKRLDLGLAYYSLIHNKIITFPRFKYCFEYVDKLSKEKSLVLNNFETFPLRLFYFILVTVPFQTLSFIIENWGTKDKSLVDMLNIANKLDKELYSALLHAMALRTKLPNTIKMKYADNIFHELGFALSFPFTEELSNYMGCYNEYGVLDSKVSNFLFEPSEESIKNTIFEKKMIELLESMKVFPENNEDHLKKINDWIETTSDFWAKKMRPIRVYFDEVFGNESLTIEEYEAILSFNWHLQAIFDVIHVFQDSEKYELEKILLKSTVANK